MKLWAGRFSKEIDQKTNDFNSSIAFDCRMAQEDIAGSMAHAAMLAKQGIISREDGRKIQEGLAGIAADLQAGVLGGAEQQHVAPARPVEHDRREQDRADEDEHSRGDRRPADQHAVEHVVERHRTSAAVRSNIPAPPPGPRSRAARPGPRSA